MKPKQLIIDPPSGWRYGFPKVLPSYVLLPKQLRKWLLKQGYPAKDLQLALKYSRYWEA